MPNTRKQQLHDHIRAEIKAAAWKLGAQNGAAALSLSAIAREMGLSTPALYRYFPGRAELLAALTADAYASFNTALSTAVAAAAVAEPTAEAAASSALALRRLCRAYYAWALEHPQEYILIFASPSAAVENLDPTASLLADNCFRILLDMLQAAADAGGLTPPPAALPAGLRRQLESVRHAEGRPYAAWALYLAVQAWSFMHGITALDLYRRCGLLLGEQVGAFIDYEIERFLQTIGLTTPGL